MNKLLIVVDMQNDFINGALGTKEAEKIVPNVLRKVKSFDGEIIFTKDTHKKNYLETREGKRLPVEHCIIGTEGFEICDTLKPYAKTVIEKPTFGSEALPKYIKKFVGTPDYIELVGLCTDICVISNAAILKAAFTESDIAVDSSCCAGVTPESHNNALKAMKMLQIDIL